MDIHMQLLQKGVKAKKKRLGGGAAPTPNFLTSTNAGLSSAGFTHSTIDVSIRDANTGIFYPNAGNINNFIWNKVPVDDMASTAIIGNSALAGGVAGTDGNTPANNLTLPAIPGDIQILKNVDLEISFDFGSQLSNGASRENFQINIIDDQAGLVSSGDWTIISQNTQAKAGFNHPYYTNHGGGLSLVSAASSATGIITIEIKMIPHGGHGATTSTTQTFNDLNNNPSIKEAIYFNIKRL